MYSYKDFVSGHLTRIRYTKIRFTTEIRKTDDKFRLTAMAFRLCLHLHGSTLSPWIQLQSCTSQQFPPVLNILTNQYAPQRTRRNLNE